MRPPRKARPGSPEPTDAAFRDAFDVTVVPRIDLGDGPVCVTIAFNEEKRLPDFLRHHRAIGVTRFIVVDNASTDGTAALLDAAPDVTRIFTTKPYSTHVRAWRSLIADRFCDGHWTIFPDADEQLVYPGWPHRGLTDAIAHWDDAGAEGVHCVMLDMYADRPMADLATTPGSRLAEVCAWFDAEGFWQASPSVRSRRRYPVPPRLVMGGARQRLLNGPGRRFPVAWEAVIRAWLPLGQPRLPPRLERAAQWLLMQNRPRAAGHQSKMAILKWRKGQQFHRGPHRVDRAMPLAEEWGVLLHFKLLDDMAEKTQSAADRGQHSRGAQGYKDTLPFVEALSRRTLTCEISARLDDFRDLHRAGLMPVSPAMWRHLKLDPGGTPPTAAIDRPRAVHTP